MPQLSFVRAVVALHGWNGQRWNKSSQPSLGTPSGNDYRISGTYQEASLICAVWRIDGTSYGCSIEALTSCRMTTRTAPVTFLSFAI
jgi:hypothetical protein